MGYFWGFEGEKQGQLVPREKLIAARKRTSKKNNILNYIDTILQDKDPRNKVEESALNTATKLTVYIQSLWMLFAVH